MREFGTSKVFAGLLAIGIAVFGTDVVGQGKGNGGRGKHGKPVERGSRAGEHPGRSIQHQVTQQQAVQPNRGTDRRAEMRQRMQQIQQQRQQQAQQWGHQNRGIDRRARMQQTQQQRQQQAQQWAKQYPSNLRRAQTQQRMQQIPQQRIQQAPQWAQQHRGSDRRAQMRRRMQQIQLQHQQQAPQWVRQKGGNERRAQIQQRLEQIQQQRQQYASERYLRGRGNGRRSSIGDRQNFQSQIVPQPKANDRFTQMANRRDWSEDRFRGGRRGRNLYSNQQLVAFNDSWPKNDRQMRRAEVHARNAERRAWRNRDSWSSNAGVYWQLQTYSRTYRPRTFYDSYVYGSTYQEPYSYSGRYSVDRNYPYYAERSNSYYSNVYEEPYYDYGEYDRPSAVDIFRQVIFAVLGGGTPALQYEPYYDSGYGSDNLSYARSYMSYKSGNYYPVDYAYTKDPSYYDPYFYQDPHYAEVLPIQYFVADQPGGGLFRQMFTQLLAVGYDQGFQDGVAARATAGSEPVFYDPYAYNNVTYDPYSVSLGDNRRCLSRGYVLGFEDALNEMDGYEQFRNGGVDLISVLIGTVSQLM